MEVGKGNPIPVTISQAFARHEDDALYHRAGKTRLNYRGTARSFIRCNGDTDVHSVLYGHILRWKQVMTSRGNALSSIEHDLSRMRTVLRYLRKHGYEVLDPDSIELPKVKKTQTVFLDYSEVQELIDAAERPRDKAIIACLFSTGCRIAELLNLNRDDIRGSEAMVHGKGGEYRPVYFDPTALRYLNEYLETRTDKLKPLFTSGRCRRITYGRVNQLIHEIVNQTSIEKRVTPHRLRDSFATDLLVNGADIRTVQELLGHKQLSSTMIYTHITDKRKQESFRKYHKILR